MASIYDTHSALHAAFEDRESDYCIENLASAAEVLEAAIAQLKSLAKAYNDGLEANWEDCKQSQRILNNSKLLIRLINGDELMLPRF